MKTLLAVAVLSLAIPAASYAQTNPFTGRWKVNAAKSTGDIAKEEFVILENTNETEHCINDIVNKEGVHTRNEYTARYNDGKWYPGKSLDTGQPTGQNLLIRLTPRSEIRLGKTGGEDVTFMVVRTVSDDGKTMTIAQLSPTGKTVATLFLEKQ